VRGETGYLSGGEADEPGYALGGGIITLLVGMLASAFVLDDSFGPPRAGPSEVITGLYLITWGVLFLASYYFSHKSFFFRGLIWVCEHLSVPRGRWMAFVYFVLATSLGTMALLTGLGSVGP
jgi:hypothetical protein